MKSAAAAVVFLAAALACSEGPPPERADRVPPPSPAAATSDTGAAAPAGRPEGAPVEESAGAPAANQSPAPPAGWTVGSVRGDGSGDGAAVLLDVRTGRQPEGWDRVVFDFGTGPLPGYRAAYVDRPQHQCGSGAEVRLAGDAWIQLDLEPAQAHDEAGRATVAERSRMPGLPNLVELRAICDFEAQVSWVLGVRSPQPFRVLRLEAPNRLVLDVRH